MNFIEIIFLIILVVIGVFIRGKVRSYGNDNYNDSWKNKKIKY